MKPRPYQEVGRDFLASRTVGLLADEMRVGKTCQAIMAAAKLGAKHTRVICPAIAVPHWHAEWHKWGGPGTLEVYSFNKWTDSAGRTPVNVTIVDEAHFAKNPLAKRTAAIYGKNGAGQCTEYLWALSGTPATKHAGELWPMMRAFGITRLDYEQFLHRYCTMDREGRITGTKKSHAGEVKALLSMFMLRRLRKDVAPELPNIGFQYLEVEPDTTADLSIPPGMTDAEILLWCEVNKITSKEDRVAVAMDKAGPLVKEVQFNIENGLLDQTVIFGWHTEPLQIVVTRLRAAGIPAELLTGQTTPAGRVRVQESFRKGLTKVVVANIMAAGTAIDLSSASHGYFLELDWVPGNNLQAANRLVSMMKQEKVTIDVVTWLGSSDDWVQRVLMRRVDELNALY